MKSKLKTIFGNKDKPEPGSEETEDGSGGAAAAAAGAALVAGDVKREEDEDSSFTEDDDEGEAVESRAVSAKFTVEDFHREKKIEKRWKVQAHSTESGIPQSWQLGLLLKGKNGHIQPKITFDATGKSFARGWYMDVRTKLTLRHQTDEALSMSKEEVLRFSAKDHTHTWEEFVLTEVVLKERGFSDAKGDPSFEFEVQIVREKGCSASFHATYGHDSFKATGFCGLKNQGATCYLNSLLQALYWIAPFRASVYRLPTEKDEPNSSIPLALQRLFYRLQFLDRPVSTTELTHSFGWGTRDVFTQHDVQELNRVLQDKIEEKMKGTTEEGQVAKLFRGKMVSYIKCLNVDYESKREEEFYDVSLVVKGCKDVYASFDKYTETETLNGDNQYAAEGHGKQDAEMGVRFIQFPPVLHLQLKRFDFDLATLKNYKVHQRYEFPRELDIRKYLDPNSPFRDEPAVYVLQGVMVHSGTAGGGHYYAYFRPTARKRWYKFNDMRVTKSTSEEAIDDNFGTGESGREKMSYASMLGGGGGGGGRSSYTSAYMLQYVRKDHFEACVAPVPESVIPPHINHRFQEEEKERARRKAEKRDAHLYCYVKVFDDKDLAAHDHLDLMDFERVRPDRVFRVLKTSTVRELKTQHLAALYDVDQPEKLRLRLFTKRRNGTIRASKVQDNDDQQIGTLVNKDSQDTFRFLVEVSQRAAAPFFEATAGAEECLIFFKFYDPRSKKLKFVTRRYLSKSSSIVSVEAELRAKLDLTPDEELLYWEEVRLDHLRIDPVDPKKTLKELELGNGDIVVLQTVLPGTDTSKEALTSDKTLAQMGSDPHKMGMPLVKQYYLFLLESISVRFKKREEADTDPGFSVMCIKSFQYAQVQEVVAQHLPAEVGCDDAHKIQFTGQSSYSLKPVWSGPFENTTTLTLQKMLQGQYGYGGGYGRLSDTIYYDILPYTIEEMKRKTTVDTHVLNLKQEVLYKGPVVVDKDATFADVVAEVRQHCAPAVPEDQALRVLDISYHKVSKVLKPDAAVAASTYRGSADVVIEFVAPDEATMEKNDRLVPCVHAEHDYFLTPHGVPFMFVFHKKESVKAIRARLAERLGLAPEVIAKWKFGTAIGGFATSFKELDDDDHLADLHKWSANSYFAMIHPNQNSSRHYRSHKQEGLVIRDSKTEK